MVAKKHVTADRKKKKNKFNKEKKKKSQVRKIDRRRIIKNPITAWIYFCNERRSQVIADNPTISFGDVCKRLAPIWASLTEEEKNKYVELQTIDRARYMTEKKSLDLDELRLLKQYKAQRRARNKSRPKPPLSGYMFYVIANRQVICAENPDAGFREIGQLLGKTWMTLTDADRAEYVLKYVEDKKRYVAELSTFNTKTL